MFIRPELQALREDDGPQRRVQADLAANLADWRSSRLGCGIDEAVAAYARGVEIEQLPPLSRLFSAGERSARRLADTFVGHFTGTLGTCPWGQVPVLSKLDDKAATLVLAASGNAVLVLQAINGAGLQALPPPVSASFSPGETHDHVLAGHGQGQLIEIIGESDARADLLATSLTCAPGTIARRDGTRQTLLFEQADTTLVVLRLQRRPERGTVTREFSLADGSLVHQATANPRESRLELTAALLGRMGRADAAPLLAAMAEEQTGHSLRWQALRECLGLDTAEGFAVLTRIAACTGDALSAPAAAMRTQLLTTYPELEALA